MIGVYFSGTGNTKYCLENMKSLYYGLVKNLLQEKLLSLHADRFLPFSAKIHRHEKQPRKQRKRPVQPEKSDGTGHVVIA